MSQIIVIQGDIGLYLLGKKLHIKVLHVVPRYLGVNARAEHLVQTINDSREFCNFQ